jgi:hypothetical protein
MSDDVSDMEVISNSMRRCVFGKRGLENLVALQTLIPALARFDTGNAIVELLNEQNRLHAEKQSIYEGLVKLVQEEHRLRDDALAYLWLGLLPGLATRRWWILNERGKAIARAIARGTLDKETRPLDPAQEILSAFYDVIKKTDLQNSENLAATLVLGAVRDVRRYEHPPFAEECDRLQAYDDGPLEAGEPDRDPRRTPRRLITPARDYGGLESPPTATDDKLYAYACAILREADPKGAELVIAQCLDGEDIKDIAARLGKTERGVRKRIDDALDRTWQLLKLRGIKVPRKKLIGQAKPKPAAQTLTELVESWRRAKLVRLAA